MFDSDSFTSDMLSNPTKLSSVVIDALEQTDTTTGTLTMVNDPNNGFVMQLFAGMCVYAKFSEKIDYIAGIFYPQRARNAKQLYSHLSEFDYTNITASPATLPFVFEMSKDWIIANAVYYDSNYNKIEIPATSYFTMGNIVYSMYYPIEILVNRNTNAVTAFYDTTSTNSLHTLESNMLRNVQEYTRNGINYFQIQFNMYQFERSVDTITVATEQGFIKTLSYTDQFYAVKVYALDATGTYNELAYSLSQMFYDYTVPTAIISILSDTSQLQIKIPQIYFDNNQISQTIRIELYTTKGKVNYSISLADAQNITANFDTKSSNYAAPLDIMPTEKILPTTVLVAGGTDALTYEEIRSGVVNQSFYNRAAITPPELQQAFLKAGFVPTRVVDDLTDRIYFAANTLTDPSGNIIPTFSGNILLQGEALAGNPSSIINYTDGYVTILPTTTFSFTSGSLTVTPLSNGQVSALAAMTSSQLVAELNKGNYVRQLFHICLYTASKSPAANIYNLLSPTMTSLAFIAENAHSAPQMSVTACQVNHLANGTGGYQILLGVTRSSNLVGVAASNLNLYLSCVDVLGSVVYLPATYVSTDSNGVDTWTVMLGTSYHINQNDHLTVTMYTQQDVLDTIEIPLNQTFTIVTSFTSTYAPTIPTNTTLNALLPTSVQATQTAMTQQTMVLSLGTNLSTSVYCAVNTSWGAEVYQTASADIYYTTNVPVFQLTETGVINHRLNTTTNAIEIVQIYAAGSTPSNTADFALPTTAEVLVPTTGTTTTFPVASTTGVLVGQPARGTNIPVNSFVAAFTETSITLNTLITQNIPAGTVLTITNTPYTTRTTAAQSAAGVQLTVASTVGYIVGQSVFGFDIAPDSTIASIDSPTHFSLNKPTLHPVANNTLLSIINTTAPGVVKIAAGSVVTDGNGNPIVTQQAQNQYLIPAILFDGRLFASQLPSDQTIVTTLSNLLQTYADQIANIDSGLTESSQVFYKPSRSMGTATFGIGNSQTIQMSLEFGFVVNIYVDTATYNTPTLLTAMTNTIYNIFNTSVQAAVISLSDIASTIKAQLGTNVTAVEVEDFAQQSGLRLVALEQSGVVPCIEYILSIQGDGTIVRQPNITINFLPQASTLTTT